MSESTTVAQFAGASLLPKKESADLLRLALLIAAITIGLMPLYRVIGSMIWFREYLGDYNVFWGIETAPIEWVYGHYNPVFAYWPTSLMLLRPFGLLPFWPSLIAWDCIGAAAITFAARRIMRPAAIALGFTTCAGVSALIEGQISLFVGALVIAALSSSQSRWRGVLLATAAMIKPQSLLAAPIALIAERNWRAIGWAAISACSLLLLSVVVFGVDTWMRWASEIPRFQAWLVSHGIDRLDVGMYGLARLFGLPGWAFVVGVPLGVATSWLVFRADTAVVDRYAAFAASSVLISPYTLSYDLAGLSFACVAMLLDRERSPLIWIAAALIVSSMFANVGIIIMASVLCYEAVGNSSRRCGSAAAQPLASAERTAA